MGGENGDHGVGEEESCPYWLWLSPHVQFPHLPPSERSTGLLLMWLNCSFLIYLCDPKPNNCSSLMAWSPSRLKEAHVPGSKIKNAPGLWVRLKVAYGLW